ncbi:hypothetical protein [Limisphaera sp. 4302-co]|uniref:hypothetical protein n=1 Tax=Limisphaera sp. 4302-co TaxID=3400417 RepID=UPI003C20D0FE
MATKLHLATFLQEIRSYTAVMDRPAPRTTAGEETLSLLAWPSHLPVGIQRRRIQVEFRSASDPAREIPVPIRQVGANRGPRRHKTVRR